MAEVVAPVLEVLHAVEEHAVEKKTPSSADRIRELDLAGARADSPIVTGGGRGNAEDEGVEVELPEAGVLGPLDALELGRLVHGGLLRLSVGLPVEDAHLECRDRGGG